MSDFEAQDAPQEAEEAVEAAEAVKDAPEPEQVEAPEPAAPEWSEEDAEEAKLFGWKPPQDWQGEKTDGYIGDPREFLDRVGRSRIFKTMQEKLETAEQTAAEQNRKLAAMNQHALESQRAQYEARMQQIQAAQREAVESADTERWDALERQRQEMAPPPVVPQQTGPRPEIVDYMQSDEGKWLNDPVLKAAGAEIIQSTPGAMHLPPREQAELARQQLETIYPQRFPKKEDPKPVAQKVDPGGLAGTPKRGAYEALPQEAKSAFKRFAAEGLYPDTKEGKEEFANVYNAA